jgi:hypothetical protein
MYSSTKLLSTAAAALTMNGRIQLLFRQETLDYFISKGMLMWNSVSVANTLVICLLTAQLYYTLHLIDSINILTTVTAQ